MFVHASRSLCEYIDGVEYTYVVMNVELQLVMHRFYILTLLSSALESL